MACDMYSSVYVCSTRGILKLLLKVVKEMGINEKKKKKKKSLSKH